MAINEPINIVSEDFQSAWLSVVRRLTRSNWELRNLIVQIKNPSAINQRVHEQVEHFALDQGLLSPKHVAYTIFPHRLYLDKGNATDLFAGYNRAGGLYARLQHRKPGWGTYFRRMTHYEGPAGTINQLENIITAMRERDRICKAAYTIIVQKPGGETVRPLGGPCLNYIAIQAERGGMDRPLRLGMLSVYRNHDFLERAYGNYWGLCNLLAFLAREVRGIIGPLTCVSSHAYIDGKKRPLMTMAAGL